MAPLSREQTFQKIQEAICRVAKIPREMVTEQSPVSGVTNVDSIMLLEIITTVEVLLKIDIDEETLFELRTVKDFVEVCHRQLATAG
ncbi:MAG: acyl carrier protein [Hyalangium sp.]|uniref:acyl carrier protein n=1 Tax=Hyalangium sp. TaxID=2028555 RepID=UPI00389AFC2A